MPEIFDKRILVTGGAGFIGSHIVDLLAAEKCRSIVVVDNFVRGDPENLADALSYPNVKLVKGDIRDPTLMSELVGGSDLVFHQAALRITHCAEDSRAALETMVIATFELAQLCAKCGVEKVIYASSASIYGMAETFPTSESHHSNADQTLYGVAKLFGEGIFRALGVPHLTLRYFNVYGPRMDIHGRYTEVLVRWMERIEAGLPPIIFGDGKQTMDFVHVRDVARINLLAAKSEVSGHAFNVASGTETSLNQLATGLAAAMGHPELVPLMHAARGVTAVERRLGDGAKARRLLGFAPKISLQDGLLDLVTWWRGKAR
jgi:UDP-glucose 4-epimerase